MQIKTLQCQSSYASKDDKITLEQHVEGGYIWITITETRNGKIHESEPIKVRLNDLLKTLAAFA